MLGKGSGEWESEIEDPEDRIVEYADVANKCYGYRTLKGKQVLKMKGVQMNTTNEKRLRYETMVKLAKGYSNSVRSKGFTFKKTGMCESMVTVKLDRLVQRNITKRKLDEKSGRTAPLNMSTLRLSKSSN